MTFGRNSPISASTRASRGKPAKCLHLSRLQNRVSMFGCSYAVKNCVSTKSAIAFQHSNVEVGRLFLRTYRPSVRCHQTFGFQLT